MGLILCFAGKIGSGKSSVSHQLAELLGWPCTGFGDYLRSEVVRCGGDPTSREQLQDLGQSMIFNDATGFCRAVLFAGGFPSEKNLIVDGIRHASVIPIIRKLTDPSAVKVIFLAAGESQRFKRVSKRETGQSDFNRAGYHPVESELEHLPAISDVVINGDQALSEVINDTLNTVEGWIKANS